MSLCMSAQILAVLVDNLHQTKAIFLINNCIFFISGIMTNIKYKTKNVN